MPNVTVEVPDELQALAAERGQTLEALARQAVAEWLAEKLEDAEDERLALQTLQRIEAGEERTYSHEEVWGDLDAVPDPLQC